MVIRISYFVLLTAFCAVIGIAMPFTPVKYTVQAVIAVISGLVLGSRGGLAAQSIYICIGIMGVPVFSFGGGVMSYLDPSFGYILGLLLASYLSGKSLCRIETLSTSKLLITCTIALFSLYCIGVPYQMLILWRQSNNVAIVGMSLIGVIISLGVDMVLIYLLSIIYPRLTTMQKIESITKF